MQTTIPLDPGARVEVRNRFDGSWAPGFEVVEDAGDGYRLRRCSDGAMLPITFPGDDLQPVRVSRQANGSTVAVTASASRRR